MNPPNGHFRAFTFVDRITSVQPGGAIRGHYHIPASLAEFSTALVAEAVGQLAAWSAMAAVDFKVRPVSGLIGRATSFAPVRPGQTLELAVEIETVDLDAVAYDGTASVEGTTVFQLQNVVGPMMPLEEFDDPAAMRRHFALLQNTGADPCGFNGVPTVNIQRTEGETGKIARAVMQVPATAPFFSDHFPRRPVFPGTLLMDLNLQLATALADEIPVRDGRRWQVKFMSDVKLRAFIPPGEMLQLSARLDENANDAATIIVETRKGTRLLGGARVQLAAEALS